MGVDNMFGVNDDNQQSNDDPVMLDNVKQLANDPSSYQAAQPQQTTPPQYMTSTPQVQTPQASTIPMQPNVQPIANDDAQSPHTPIAEPAQGFSSSPMPEPPVGSEPTSDDQTVVDDQMIMSPLSPINTEHLAGMKQQALEHLEPLIGHLDQSPEESFKTTMMMIQANDNHTLLEQALEQAKKIEDDKERANAMLDIINEINYFSQNQ